MTIESAAVRKIIRMIPFQDEDIPNEELYRRVFGIDDAQLQPLLRVAEQIEQMEFRPEMVLASEDDILGTYRPMHSPGVVTLYWDRIGGFMWHTLLELAREGFVVGQADAINLAQLAVHKTWTHELFHHACDVGRHLFGGSCEHDREEALAVAWSHRRVTRRYAGRRHIPRRPRFDDRVNPGLTGAFIERAWRYTAPGYRDWARFSSDLAFSHAVAEYLIPDATYRELVNSRVDVDDIICNLVESAARGGGVEEVLKP